MSKVRIRYRENGTIQNEWVPGQVQNEWVPGQYREKVKYNDDGILEVLHHTPL